MDAILPAAGECPVTATRQAAYLLAVAGHDLRQPLQVISMVLDRIMPALGDRDSRLASIALSQVRSMTNSLTDLATASQFGTDAPILSPVALGRAMKHASESWRYHADAKHLKLTVVDTDAQIDANEALLNTILRNLIGNAVQHTLSGGVVIGCRRARCSLRIDVVDTGPGITATEVERMFLAFEHGTLSNGLGLGLALAKEAATKLGASLTVRTKIGRGSCFSVAFPRTRIRMPPAATDSRASDLRI